MFGGTYFGEGYFAGEPATQQAQADNAPPAPVVPTSNCQRSET